MTGPTEDFRRRIGETFAFAMKVKAEMLKRGLVAGRKRCPRCGGWVRFRLVGQRRHMHAACDTADCIRVME